MSWSLYRWVWQLEAPLFVGVPPAGTLNRCRLYVPARAIWGACTAELAQAGGNGFPEYRQKGEAIRQSARFTYLFPARLVNGTWLAWLPEYVQEKGLIWRREDQSAEAGAVVPDRRFRRWLIDTRPGTAIDPDSDSAAEASLRETECVMTRWRSGNPNETGRVALAGYVFLKDGLASDLRKVTTLFLGGDTRYGLGRVRRIEFAHANDVFGAPADLDDDSPRVRSPLLQAHGDTTRALCGACEALTGWDRTAGGAPTPTTPRWVPGSRLPEPSDVDVAWRIDKEGTWNDSE